jgi:hypothetical protein
MHAPPFSRGIQKQINDKPQKVFTTGLLRELWERLMEKKGGQWLLSPVRTKSDASSQSGAVSESSRIIGSLQDRQVLN